MAQATLSEVKDRIVLLCGLIEGIKTVVDDMPEDNQPFKRLAELPAIMVKIGTATYQIQSRHQMIVTRQWQLVLLVGRTAEDTQDPDTDALEAVEPYLLRVAAFFGQHPRLEYNDAGIVISANIEGDGGIGSFPLKDGATYMGSTQILTTVTRHMT